MDALTKVYGNPTTDIVMLYIRDIYTDATGVIRNITCTAVAEGAPDKVVEGVSIVPGKDYEIQLDNDKALTGLTFDYKVTSGTFNIALLPNWENYYGYFAFDEYGNVDAYDGVTCKDLGNGYYRVTIDLDVLNKKFGNPDSAIAFLYVRGAWSDANGEITNIGLYWNETKQIKKGTSSFVSHILRVVFATGLK